MAAIPDVDGGRDCDPAESHFSHGGPSAQLGLCALAFSTEFLRLYLVVGRIIDIEFQPSLFSFFFFLFFLFFFFMIIAPDTGITLRSWELG